MSQSSVFNGVDPECGQIRTVYFRPTDTRIVEVICCKMFLISHLISSLFISIELNEWEGYQRSFLSRVSAHNKVSPQHRELRVKFQQYCVIRSSKGYSMWKISVLSIFPSRYDNTLETNGDSPARSFTTCHPPEAKKGFVKDETLWLLRTNSSNKTFEENITTFKKNTLSRDTIRKTLLNNPISAVKFEERAQALLQRNKTKKWILPFVTQYHPAVPNLKENLTRKWFLIQQQPLLNQIFKEPPIISQRKRRSLKHILV